MHWLQAVDTSLFRFINLALSNPVFDLVMPFVSGNPLSRAIFFPVLALAAVFLIWRGGSRGRLFVGLALLIVWLGDSLVINTIKHAVDRQRPYFVVTEAHTLLGRGHSPGMPSSHAANWFAATIIAYVYYRRSWRFMLPLAILVSFSRVYNGVHYPSDVLAGAILGAGYACAAIWSLEALWQWAGWKWFPLWYERMPSVIERRGARGEGRGMAVEGDAGWAALDTRHSTLDTHFLRLGYILIAVVLVARLAYLASGFLELTGDEAYQWLWSKHLALSYYSKPPLIAYVQFLGTHLFGDTAFGVRFFSPILSAILSFILLRFFAREVSARAGFFLLLINLATPFAAVGAILMTVDPLLILFWAAAMITGWRAVQADSTKYWLWTGLWMGLGFLSKYTELFQLLSWALFFAFWPAARMQLRRPGPYLALLVTLICALPVVIWNYQHHWVTMGHVAGDAAVGVPWKATMKHLGDLAGFVGAEAALLNPIFFVAMIWAALRVMSVECRVSRGLTATHSTPDTRHSTLGFYFLCMGGPVFVIHLLYTLHSRVLPNWIAPAVVPLFCLMVVYWEARWRAGVTAVKGWLIAGITIGLVFVIIGHDTYLIGKVTGRLMPVNSDPLHRGRGWKEVARLTSEARRDLLADGKPVFIIADHYRLAGEISFYLPEAEAADPERPLVYCRTGSKPVDQFYFWPHYQQRKGENAIYVIELDRDKPQPIAPPGQLVREFTSVTDLGMQVALDHGRPLWRLQFFACRDLR
jgi:4-amino-4-deoxy-L-arabinose transferase-like glycosyltransferase/membrane-associated phospholipid phosphatase